MPRQLTITPAPFKSSYLAIPPTPFSPRLPISPPAQVPKQYRTIDDPKLKASAQLQPPPPEPLHWLWQCHRCNRVYHLGVTRRCLDDGHFFCAGTTVVKRSKKNGYKKTLRHQACASEFDYQGWKSWGNWRRGLSEQLEAADALHKMEMALDAPSVPGEGKWFAGVWSRQPTRAEEVTKKSREKDCWATCDYPSECRWGKQYGIVSASQQTPKATVTIPSMKVLEEEPEPATEQKDKNENWPEPQAKTSFEDILFDLDVTDPESSNYLEPLVSQKSQDLTPTEKQTHQASMSDLLDSSQRRKRKSMSGIPLIPSPLGANPPSPTLEKPTLSKSYSAEVVETLEVPATSSSSSSTSKLQKSASSSALQRAFDDLERGLGLKMEGWIEKKDDFVESLKGLRR